MDTKSKIDPLASLPAPMLIARIRELEARLARYERSTAISTVLMAPTPVRTAASPPAPLGRPPDLERPARLIFLAKASMPGGTIDQWMLRYGIAPRPLGRVRNSSHTRIRTMVLAIVELYERQTGERISEGRQNQVITRIVGEAKAGRALLKSAENSRGIFSPPRSSGCT